MIEYIESAEFDELLVRIIRTEERTDMRELLIEALEHSSAPGLPTSTPPPARRGRSWLGKGGCATVTL